MCLLCSLIHSHQVVHGCGQIVCIHAQDRKEGFNLEVKYCTFFVVRFKKSFPFGAESFSGASNVKKQNML